MTGPRVVVEHTEWIVAIDDPKMCNGVWGCGHLHYPRRPTPNPWNVAPNWKFCEDEDCTCRTLQSGKEAHG